MRWYFIHSVYRELFFFFRFGGTIYSPRTGIILNNELSDFCLRAEKLRAGKVTDINTALQSEATELKALHNAVIQPVSALIRSVIVVVGEQPPSSMTPIIAESKSGGLLVMGGSGGSMITSAVALVSWLNSRLHDCLLRCLFAYTLLFRSLRQWWIVSGWAWIWKTPSQRQ